MDKSTAAAESDDSRWPVGFIQDLMVHPDRLVSFFSLLTNKISFYSSIIL